MKPRLIPGSLFGRVMLILFLGLIITQLLSFQLVWYERVQASWKSMLEHMARDVALTVELMEELPKNQRARWLSLVQKPHYQFSIEVPVTWVASEDVHSSQALEAIREILGEGYPIQETKLDLPAQQNQFSLTLRLQDNSLLTIIPKYPFSPPPTKILLGYFTILLGTLITVVYVAVRLVTRPLADFAQAADSLGKNLKTRPLDEAGPTEVSRAAAAFNAMQARINHHFHERTQLLAAISHDLQTPITRMRLRTEFMEEGETRDKLYDDLNIMQSLVEEGLRYARSIGNPQQEPLQPVDIDALLHSIAGDFCDAGAQVTVNGRLGYPLPTRIQTLRRIIENLVDNAIKFAGVAEIIIEPGSTGQARPLQILVCDNGPGIPETELNNVLQPFYRIETSRNRDTGGTGLGLAIAYQLTQSLDGSLILRNRPGGGLEARVVFGTNH